MPYCPIIGTLGYVLSADGEQVLMIHRNARPDDQRGRRDAARNPRRGRHSLRCHGPARHHQLARLWQEG